MSGKRSSPPPPDHERVFEHHVDVVCDEHECGRAKVETDAACRVGDHERGGAEPGEHARGKGGDLGCVTFIQMKAPALHDTGTPSSVPPTARPCGPGRRLGEARDSLYGMRTASRTASATPAARAEHDRGARLELPESSSRERKGLFETSARRSSPSARLRPAPSTEPG